MGGKLAIGAKRERPTIKDKLILPTNHVDIEERAFGLQRPADSMRHPAVRLQQVERRGVQRDDDLGPGFGKTFDNIRCPDILADRQAKPPSPHHHRPRHLASREVALVIEDAVIRQIDLVATRQHGAIIKHEHRIGDHPVLDMRGADDDGRTAIGCRAGKRLKARRHLIHEVASQHKVIARIA